MSLPEFVTPVLSIAGPVALVYVILRLGPDAVLRLLAGIVAVMTDDKERGERCLEVLRALRAGTATISRHPCLDTSPDSPPAPTVGVRRGALHAVSSSPKCFKNIIKFIATI
jgi:hypothetical protein